MVPELMARRSAPGGTPATVALTRAGVGFTSHPYDHDPAAESFGLEAARVLGVDPGRVFKTLFVSADGRLAVGVVPVSGQLDLKAVAAALGAKRAVMADPAAAERASGYVVGGISPVRATSVAGRDGIARIARISSRSDIRSMMSRSRAESASSRACRSRRVSRQVAARV